VASSAQWTSSTTITVGRPASSWYTAPNTASRPAPGSTAAASAGAAPRAMSRNGPRVRGVTRSSQAPASTLARPAASRANALTRLVLPIPASPETSTTEPRPCPAPLSVSRSRRSSASRSSKPADIVPRLNQTRARR
jgi:hypothetical protein